MIRYQIIPVTPFQQNCTVFWNEETKIGAIVDPGGDIELLDKFIDEQGLTIEKSLTHGHLDHVGSVRKWLSAEYTDYRPAYVATSSGLTGCRKRPVK